MRNFHQPYALIEYIYLKRKLGEENIRLRIDDTKYF